MRIVKQHTQNIKKKNNNKTKIIIIHSIYYYYTDGAVCACVRSVSQ